MHHANSAMKTVVWADFLYFEQYMLVFPKKSSPHLYV